MENIAGKVQAIVLDSLYNPEEVPDGKAPDDAVIVDGVMGKMGFHPQRLESHRHEVEEILREMPANFHKDSGGGWSFLNLCMDKNGNQWAEHMNMNELCVLAIGLKLGKWLLPRDLWSALPGGMPYVVFDVPQAAAV